MKMYYFRIESVRKGITVLLRDSEREEYCTDEEMCDDFYNFKRLADLHEGELKVKTYPEVQAIFAFPSAANALKAYSDLKRFPPILIDECFSGETHTKLCIPDTARMQDAREKGFYAISFCFPRSCQELLEKILNLSSQHEFVIGLDKEAEGNFRRVTLTLQNAHSAFCMAAYIQGCAEKFWLDTYDDCDDDYEGEWECSYFVLQNIGHDAYRRDFPYPLGSAGELMRERMEIACVEDEA
jgi:hypothetical protein